MKWSRAISWLLVGLLPSLTFAWGEIAAMELSQMPEGADPADRIALVIHGGGGVLPPEEMTPELENAYRAALQDALLAGYGILSQGGSSVDAVEAAIVVMEDSPLFNAGKGSSFNIEGVNELDASIMDGRTLDAGGVAVVRSVRNPIKLARVVMERTPHVLMAAEGADLLARQEGMELVPPHYFWTERRWQMLHRHIQENLPYGDPRRKGEFRSEGPLRESDYYGTVGAVAMDREGNLAAGTSTGGRMGKMPGRVGDSPIIGAGTYADNRTAAVSSTGLGEYVLRVLGTKRVADLMEHQGLSLDDAVESARGELVDMGATISMIAVDSQGEISMRYSGRGMYRGYIREDGEPSVFIYDR